MRKLLATLLGASVAAVMLYGVVGTGAVFSDRGTVSQTVTMGGVGLRITSTTEGAVLSEDGHTLTCPALWAQWSSGSLYSAACRFKVETIGTPGNIVITATTTASPGMENDKIQLSKISGGSVTLPLADTPMFQGFGVVDDGVYFQFAGLTNASAGGTVGLVLTIDATEAQP